MRDAYVQSNSAYAGTLGGWSYADVVGCYATGAVVIDGAASSQIERRAGGLFGTKASDSSVGAGSIASSYSIASATAAMHPGIGVLPINGNSGGLVASSRNFSGSRITIDNSWAAGVVTGTAIGESNVGGLVGNAIGPTPTAAASYYDAQATGQTATRGGGLGLSTAALQRPTGYTGIYAFWDDLDLDGDGRIDADDDAWDFGTSTQYPSLKWGGFDPATQFAVPDAVAVEESPPPNGPPAPVGSVDDVDLSLGETARVPLAGRFADEHPERLTYAVSSSNPAAVAARLAGPAVALEGAGHGAAIVTVTATDTRGLSAAFSFVVRSGVAISFAADASAPEGGTILLALTASRPASEALVVPYALTAGDDTAAAGEPDHAGGAGGAATFAAGATRAEIALPVLDDEAVEPVRERFTIALAEPAADAGYGLGIKPQAVATVEEGVCDRDPAVRDELRRQRPCEAVADLSRQTSLRLRGAGIERLRGEDLLGLSGLALLDASGNRLRAFPAAALTALPNLRSLRLEGNRIEALPAGLEHSALWLLDLSGNGLAALPAGSLSGLAGLRRLHLSGNALAGLPGDAFAGLGSLRSLRLDGNRLRALPAGLFAGLNALDELHLHGNPGAPFTLAVGLARTDADPWAPGPASVTAGLAAGAPFALRVALAAADGAAAGEVAVAAGATRSGTAEVPDGGAPLTLAARPAPAPNNQCPQEPFDVPCHSGFAVAAGEPLTLYKAPPRAAALAEQALAGGSLRLPLAQRFGVAVGEALAYSARSSDASVASVRVTDGVLVVEAEGEGVATVTVTATDAYGQTGALAFTVRATPPARGGLRGWRLILIEEQEPPGDA